MADLSNTQGRTRVTIGAVARVLEITRRQGQRHASALREAGLIIRQGLTWTILGVADHDIATCDHDWCAKEHRTRCRPRTNRPRRYADPTTWQRMATARPPKLATAVLDAAQATAGHPARPDTPRLNRKRKRHGGGRSP
jgi:hypothetical protein